MTTSAGYHQEVEKALSNLKLSGRSHDHDNTKLKYVIYKLNRADDKFESVEGEMVTGSEYSLVIVDSTAKNTGFSSKDPSKRTNEETDNANRKAYEQFVALLPADECRWALFNFVWVKDGGPRDKIIFISWSPDNSITKQKMAYASSKKALCAKLQVEGLPMIFASDYDEISYEIALKKVDPDTKMQ
ncbi:actin depolymerizing protein [Rickenella mellea]|uniref:Cofilin n=1 Tax=Rickenella mellea TaxID=50990 RepID=A0A4Y7Q7X8_9AGAM|nr:actin depolymerizing protein [Rickenella mellea]